jgi:polar amino acid transport system substrate-binding protein
MAQMEQSSGSSRRQFLRRSALLAGLAAGVSALLSACQLGAPAGGNTAPAQTGTTVGGKLGEVLQRGKVIVGTGSTNPPWHFEDESGNLVGMDIEMAKIVSKGLFDKDDKIEFVKQKPDARIPNLQTDKVDVVIQFMTVTPQRAQNVEFTIPYYREAVNLLLPASSPYNGAKDMVGKKTKISILQNSFAEDLVHHGVPDAEVLQLDTQANAILALDSGRVDAAAVDDSTCRWLYTQNPGKYKVGNYSWDANTYSMAVKPGDQRWLNWLNTVIHEAVLGLGYPDYAAAFKKYFGVDIPVPQAGFPIEYGGLQKA